MGIQHLLLPYIFKNMCLGLWLLRQKWSPVWLPYLTGQGTVLQVLMASGTQFWGHSEAGRSTLSSPFIWTHLTGRTISPVPQEALQGPNTPVSHLGH